MVKDLLSEKILLKVSNLVTTTFQAEQLAGVLEIDENFVTLEKEQHYLNPRQIAYYNKTRCSSRPGNKSICCGLYKF